MNWISAIALWKWNSRQKAPEASCVNVCESNFRVKAQLRYLRHATVMADKKSRSPLKIQLLTWVVQKPSFFSKLCVCKQCSQCSCSCVETPVIPRVKFHVVSSLLSVLKIAIWMLAYERPSTPLKISLNLRLKTTLLILKVVPLCSRFQVI